MKHEYLILKEHNLILESFYGKMDVDGYLRFKMEQINDPDYDSSYNVLSDLRWVEFVFPAAEMHKISDFFKENIQLNEDRKGCLLSIDPLQTAYSMVFKNNTSVGKVTWMVCTTLKETIQWLRLDFDEDYLSLQLREMKRKLVLA